MDHFLNYASPTWMVACPWKDPWTEHPTILREPSCCKSTCRAVAPTGFTTTNSISAKCHSICIEIGRLELANPIGSNSSSSGYPNCHCWLAAPLSHELVQGSFHSFQGTIPFGPPFPFWAATPPLFPSWGTLGATTTTRRHCFLKCLATALSEIMGATVMKKGSTEPAHHTSVNRFCSYRSDFRSATPWGHHEPCSTWGNLVSKPSSQSFWLFCQERSNRRFSGGE